MWPETTERLILHADAFAKKKKVAWSKVPYSADIPNVKAGCKILSGVGKGPASLRDVNKTKNFINLHKITYVVCEKETRFVCSRCVSDA